MSFTPFIEATKRLIIKNTNVTDVKVCQNLFLPVNFNIAKYEAAFMVIHNINNVADQNDGIAVLIADK